MNLNDLIDQPIIIVEAWFKKKDTDKLNLTPEEEARRQAQIQKNKDRIATRQAAMAKEKERQHRDTARLRTKQTPTDIPTLQDTVPAPPRTPLPKKPKHEDNGGVGPRFGDYLESGNGLWKIIGNDSANMVAYIQNPVTGEKQAVEWADMIKDRDHKGKSIFVKG